VTGKDHKKYSRRIYGQKPQEFLFTKYINKICVGSVMEAKLVRTIDKYWNAVWIWNDKTTQLSPSQHVTK